MVPCEGLYADIADDSLNQKLDDVYAVFQQKIGGSISCQFFFFKLNNFFFSTIFGAQFFLLFVLHEKIFGSLTRT